MVFTKEELIASLQHEIRVLLHLAGKVEPSFLEYRPTPGQRSTLELLQYMAIMAPTQLAVIQSGVFDRPTLTAAWAPAEAASKQMSFDEAVAAIAKQSTDFERVLSAWTDADFRSEVDLFGQKKSRGWTVVNLILSAFAAYRTQLFCYLKCCGRTELNTVNLWMGTDSPATPASEQASAG